MSWWAELHSVRIHAEAYKKSSFKLKMINAVITALGCCISEFCFTESTDYSDHFHCLVLVGGGRWQGYGKGGGLPTE